MQIETNSYVRSAKRHLVRIAAIYVLLIGIWMFIQSGIPFSLITDMEVARITWIQTLNGWFFVVSSGWLLYLLVGRGLDVMARTEEALRLRDRAIESSGNAIFITDHLKPDNPIVYANPAFERITGYPVSEVMGKNPRFLQGSDTRQPELEAIRLALTEQRHYRGVLRNYRRDGRMFWNELYISPVRNQAGQITHYVGVQNDITEARNYQEELARQAHFDSLTGLPNRNLLTDRIRTAVTRAVRNGQTVAVAVADLDNFRLVNESLGHESGDRLLQLAAERLQSCIRAGDTVARTGGDGFALVFADQAADRLIPSEIQRIVGMFERPFVVNGRELFVTVSIGVVFSPQDGDEVEVLLTNAESAMHQSKKQGRNTFRLYSSEMNAVVSERLELDSKLRKALERGEFLLHYQPQVDFRTNRIIGVEALLRWNSPDHGSVPPAKFIPLTEETGLVIPIGEWVIRTACAQNRAWQMKGFPPLVVAVNISVRQFCQPDLISRVEAALRDTGLDPRYLELEVTESAIMHNAQDVISKLEALKAMGVQLSIDDFGTGYSSLSYLKRFPVDRLKIDQSFVRDISVDPDSAAIAQAIINLGHSMNLRVIAEGVETPEQLAYLGGCGCDERQGYLFSKPLAADAFEQLLIREEGLPGERETRPCFQPVERRQA